MITTEVNTSEAWQRYKDPQVCNGCIRRSSLANACAIARDGPLLTLLILALHYQQHGSRGVKREPPGSFRHWTVALEKELGVSTEIPIQKHVDLAV